MNEPLKRYVYDTRQVLGGKAKRAETLFYSI